MAASASKIAVHLDDFHARARDALRLASRLGFGAVQFGAVGGELSPQQLSESGRRDLQRYSRGLGLNIAALRADLGSAAFLDGAVVGEQVERTRHILELARDLNVAVVSAPIGRFTANNSAQYNLVREAVRHVAEHADKLDRFFAIETAVESPEALQQLLADLNCPNLKVSYDPAELLMDGLDPLAPIELFADHILLSQVRDAELGSSKRPGRETNLGQGHLNLAVYLQRLEEADYNRELVIRRDQSANPIADLQACKEQLETVLTSRAGR